MPSRAPYYRRRAAEARAAAEQISNPETRAHMLESAAIWDKVADTAEWLHRFRHGPFAAADDDD